MVSKVAKVGQLNDTNESTSSPSSPTMQGRLPVGERADAHLAVRQRQHLSVAMRKSPLVAR